MKQFEQLTFFLCLISSAACLLSLIYVYRKESARFLFSRSFAAAEMLLDAYRIKGDRLLLWCGICFACLLINSFILMIDFVILPEWDLAIIRHLTALVGVICLLYGFLIERGPMTKKNQRKEAA